MSCEATQPDLVAYHFGVISDEARGALEAHLLSCPDCLGAFIALKREIETAELDPRPSPAARQRLRLAVAEELGIRQPRRARWSWWERPLAFGVASAAVAAALLLLSMISTMTGSMPHTLRDQAEQGASSPARTR